MKLTVVGCSGSYPGPDAACSCYLVEAAGFRLLLDLGNGALGPLQRHLDPSTAVDAVLLSHLHPDHCIDLCSYYVLRKYHPAGPAPVLPVYGPAGTAERIAWAYGLPPGEGMAEVFEFRILASGSFDLGPLRVRVGRVNHPVETFAFRLEHAGRSLTYSADTGQSADLVELARGADLLLCEASFQDGRDDVPDLHLTGREAGEHARAAGVGRLLLTHVPPWTDPQAALAGARDSFGPAAELVRPGASYSVGQRPTGR